MSIHEPLAIAPTILVTAPPEWRDRVRRDMLRVAVVRHPGLAEVTRVAVADDGVEAEYAVPPSSQRVLSGDALAGDAAVSVLAPVAAGLALLHDAGLVHGAVGIDRLWRRADGAGLLGPGSGAGAPADDVRDFALMLERLLPERSVGSDIAHLLIAGGDPDPALRPSMARIAAVLDAASRRAHPLTSPPAHRRVPVAPAAAASPLAAGAGVRHPGGAAARRGGLTRRRARHAASAPVGRWPLRLSWRVLAVAVGIGAVAFVGIGAVRGADAPPVCPVTPAADASAAHAFANAG